MEDVLGWDWQQWVLLDKAGYFFSIFMEQITLSVSQFTAVYTATVMFGILWCPSKHVYFLHCRCL